MEGAAAAGSSGAALAAAGLACGLGLAAAALALALRKGALQAPTRRGYAPVVELPPYQRRPRPATQATASVQVQV